MSPCEKQDNNKFKESNAGGSRSMKLGQSDLIINIHLKTTCPCPLPLSTTGNPGSSPGTSLFLLCILNYDSFPGNNCILDSQSQSKILTKISTTCLICVIHYIAVYTDSNRLKMGTDVVLFRRINLAIIRHILITLGRTLQNSHYVTHTICQ